MCALLESNLINLYTHLDEHGTVTVTIGRYQN